jgi:uncharacterized phosphosugar-binding protein
MSARQFFSALRTIYDAIEASQMETIGTVATLGAEAIAAGRFVLLFGSGHSFIPTMDTYPRIGSYPGWLPLHELSTSYMASVTGNQGLRQALFLEKVEGFGRVVLANYRLDPRDLMIVISHSGVNPMGIDVALSAREQGLKTVAITSLAHSRASRSRHSSGKRLYEVCDLVIDTCVPQGDALVRVAGFGHPVAASSTIAACIIMQALVAETAQRLAARGISLPVFPSHNAELSLEERAALEAATAAWYEEHARRTSSFYR